MKKLILILIPILLIGGYFFLKGGSKVQAEPTLPTSTVEERSIQSTVYLNGSISTEEVRKIKPSANTKIDEISVEVGDKVKKGDVIAKMNSDTLNSNLKSKESQLEIAVVKLDRLEKGSDLALNNGLKDARQAKVNAENKMRDDKALLDAGIITKQQYDASVTAYESAKTAYSNASYNVSQSSREFEIFSQKKTIESLEDEIAILKKSIEDNLVKAPIDGTVTTINSTEGEAVTENLMVISNFDKNVIIANVSEADINKIVVGQKVEVTANSAKGKTFLGKVSFISPGSKNISGKKQAYVEIKVMLDERAPELRTNFSVNLKIVTASKEGVKAVRFEAIKTRNNGEDYVLVQNADGMTKEVTIKSGITDDVYVEAISDELKVNDIIIIDNSNIQEEEGMGFF